MASTHKSLRSGTANKRPTTSIAEGQIALNTNTTSPGLYFKDSTGALIIKVGPVHVGTTAPNVAPAGSSGNSNGETWLDTSLTPNGWKVWTGAAWVNATPVGSTTVQGLLELATNAETQAGSDTERAVTPAGLQSKLSDSTSTTSSTTIASSTAVKAAFDLANAALPKSGGTITGDLEIGSTGSLLFEGSTADAFETTLTVVDPTADRVIAFPNISGTVVTTGDTGTVTGTMIADSTITNADISATAAIAGTKISPDFGAQSAVTTGTVTGGAFIPTSSTIPTNGTYLSAANQLSLATNSTERLRIDPNGALGIAGANYGTSGQVLTSNGTGAAPSWQASAGGSSNSISQGNSSATVTDTGSDGNFVVTTEGSEALRVDPSRRLLVGTTIATNAVHGAWSSASALGSGSVYCAGNSSSRQGIHISQWNNNAADNCGFLIFYRANSSAVGTYSLVSNNDPVGSIEWNIGGTSTTLGTLASFQACVDGTPSSTSTPGRIVFSTTLSTNRLTVERLRITSDGTFAYNQAAPTAIDTSATATITTLKARLITSTTASAVTITLPTGTSCEGGFNGLYTNITFEWTVINTGATNAVTIAGNTAHTIVGSATVAASTSGRFATRRTATNTFVTYRLS